MSKQPEKLMQKLGEVVGLKPKSPVSPAPAESTTRRKRHGRAALLTEHDTTVLKQLKVLAAEQDTTQQKLVAEALNLLFNRYGKPPIA